MFNFKNQPSRYAEIRKLNVARQAQRKVQDIARRLEQGIAYWESIERECLTECFFAFPAVTPKLIAILDRYLIRSHSIVDNAALPEVRALLTEFNVNNCKLS